MGNKLQEFLPIGKVMSKLEIDAGARIVPFPLAEPSVLHLVSTFNCPKPCDLSNSCLDSSSLYYLFFHAYSPTERKCFGLTDFYILSLGSYFLCKGITAFYLVSLPCIWTTGRECTTMVPGTVSLHVTVFHFKLEFVIDTSVYP